MVYDIRGSNKGLNSEKEKGKQMKKYLTPVLAVVAVLAIIFCFVFNGQKGNLQKTIDDVKAQMETLKTESEEKSAAAETAKTEAEAQLETLKKETEEKLAAAETAKAEVETQLETLKKETEEKLAAAEAAKAEAETKLADLEKQAAEKVEEAKAAVEEAVKTEEAPAEEKPAEEAPAAEAAAAEAPAEEKPAEETPAEEAPAAEAAVMSHADYLAAENDTEVVIESYVQDHQSWWDGKVTVYLQSEDGAYFAYELKATEEEAAKLTQGQKVRIKGFKGEWAGEVEIMDGTVEFLEGDPYVAAATDVTELLGKDELAQHMNEFVAVKGATIVDYDGNGAAFAYKNAEEKSDDLYFKVDVGGQVYEFCVEFYLRGKDTDVYKAVEGLKVGDVVDLEGFLYWYNGANLQATSLTVK